MEILPREAAGNMGENSCIACRAENAKYKCPKCRARYCSVACSKAHKENAEACEAMRAFSNTDKLAIAPSTAETSGVPLQGEEANKHDSSGQFRLLSEDEKQKLLSNEEITAAIRSKRLRDDLDTIDSAKNRTAALRRARNNPEFEEFVQKMLKSIA
jgi:hypothetical protein